MRAVNGVVLGMKRKYAGLVMAYIRCSQWLFVSILAIRGWGYMNYGSPPQRGLATWEDSGEALPTKDAGRCSIYSFVTDSIRLGIISHCSKTTNSKKNISNCTKKLQPPPQPGHSLLHPTLPRPPPRTQFHCKRTPIASIHYFSLFPFQPFRVVFGIRRV